MTLDYNIARKKMVDRQIRTVDVTNEAVLEAFLEVPREVFVPATLLALAYSDDELQVAPGRFMTPPDRLARLIQAAAVKPQDVVLLIGCGVGYSAAVLSRLASSVVAVESDPDLAKTASANLSETGSDNVVVVEGELAKGYGAEGPYDVILIDGAIGYLPDAVAAQLKPEGRLIAAMGTGNAAYAQLWINDGGDISARRLFNCALHLLPGFEKAREFEF